jgi:hypothetical protein
MDTRKLKEGRHLRPVLVLVLLLFGSAVLAGRFYARSFFPPVSLGESASNPERKINLWVWERPEKLDYLDPAKFGVAFLAKTLYLRGERVVMRPRLQSLSVAPGTPLTAVTRIESDRLHPPLLTASQETQALSEILALANTNGIQGLQIDFDAKASERQFYRKLLVDLHGSLPRGVKLSMTALASWCTYDNWISDLPIDEAVPMLFRMGVDRRQILLDLRTDGDFRCPLCRSSIGISLDEPLPGVVSKRRVFVFNPKQWSPERVRSILERSNDDD